MQLRLVFFSAGTSVSSSGVAASPDPLFMVEYLVNTCGFSADDASKVSKSLPRNKSTENPDVVLGFLRYQGFDGANLRKVISLRPRLLGCHVEKNLAPKFQIFRDMGLSESDVIDVVLLHPAIIDLNFQNTLLPRLKVWESLFGSKEILLNNLRRHGWFMTTNIENVVRPNMNFLQDECDRAEGIGIPRGSGMFLWILDVLHGVSREKFEAQVKLMNSFDFSNSDFVAAIKKYPWFLWLSTETLQRKMEFLVKDVGITPSNIAKQPVFLALSLEKRVIPRFHVLEILKSEGLWTSQDTLRTIFLSPGPKFMQKKLSVELLPIRRDLSFGMINSDFVPLLHAELGVCQAAIPLCQVKEHKFTLKAPSLSYMENDILIHVFEVRFVTPDAMLHSLSPLPCGCSINPTPMVFFSAVSSVGFITSLNPHFMIEYLVSACGFSLDDASKARIVDVEKNLAPKFHMGLSESDVANVIDLMELAFPENLRCSSVDIAKQPVFLQLSLEKRSIPRFHVMEILKYEGLWTSQKLSTFFLSPGSNFFAEVCAPLQS
ncbi:hypothetical protein ZIOFF_056952 [Zingiber officinale]|uniref:Uncharacterized protein n=1 Tax=Zingiber officinale TaxID=94328 RepID=A0A8J5KLC1_ZINOF|nr:hypothetical protein ZIOFF_056952 [Zingiber officinale]